MTPEQLRKLIESDAEAKKLAESGAADLCAKRCMEIAPKTIHPLAAATIQREASLIGAWGKIRIAADSASTPPELRAVCITLVDWIQQQWPVDFSLPQVQAMVGAFVAAGFLTQQQVDGLVELSKVGPSISGGEITTAMMLEVK